MSSLNTHDASGSVLSLPIPNPRESTFGPPTGGSYRTPAAQKRAQVQPSHHSDALERRFMIKRLLNHIDLSFDSISDIKSSKEINVV